jgi:hypothetical protein
MEAILTEPENINYVISLLSKDFVCVVEDIENNLRIKGIHPTGKTLFIDALIRPKNPDGWRNGKNTVFGIEFKKDYQKGGNLIKHIAQSIDYSQSDWYYKGTKIGRIPILLYPSSAQSKHPYNTIGGFIIRLLGMFNIGSIEIFDKYKWELKGSVTLLQIRMSDASLYRSDLGPSGNAKSNKLELKVGSR